MAGIKSVPHIPHPPPGLERSIPPPDVTAKTPFHYATSSGADAAPLEGETAYYVWGDLTSSQHVPLVVVHGGPGMTHNYMLPFALLHADYGIPVVLYDQIGCGQSTRHQDRNGDRGFWTVELFVKQLGDLIQHLKLAQFDLLGHSWGGFMVGSFVLAQKPTGLRKLVVCNSPSDLARLPVAVDQLVSRMPEDVQAAFRQCKQAQKFETPGDKAVEMFVYGLHSYRRPPPWPQPLTDTMIAVTEDPTSSDTMVGTSVLFMNGSFSTIPSLGDRLHEISETTCPGGILVVTAEHDLAVPDVCSDWWTKPRTASKRVHLELSSHFSMMEEPEALLEAIGVFLTHG